MAAGPVVIHSEYTTHTGGPFKKKNLVHHVTLYVLLVCWNRSNRQTDRQTDRQVTDIDRRTNMQTATIILWVEVV